MPVANKKEMTLICKSKSSGIDRAAAEYIVGG